MKDGVHNFDSKWSQDFVFLAVILRNILTIKTVAAQEISTLIHYGCLLNSAVLTDLNWPENLYGTLFLCHCQWMRYCKPHVNKNHWTFYHDSRGKNFNGDLPQRKHDSEIEFSFSSTRSFSAGRFIQHLRGGYNKLSPVQQDSPCFAAGSNDEKLWDYARLGQRHNKDRL